ncbi:MAG: MFS transporter [Phenylobacterium sp.]|jgi:GPH family glycoside/pentoside/hexuronide:cation symporter|uniref:MFS transporter n=1 Tax=Phenylobacterium sp. TaxID=1871053 RepID=UPI0025DDE9E4|nr:MFS transporter [Phenylobacterium sp.]MCA3710434.1 MFS transporter [Phenylobacterium sp.]MCA3738395.1 MFS transporter [Phenylobacterium sp.]MCA3746000.1 MFS transporter [Phenylobacterium sp.]MCA3753231.1 MFS transporter [Phenylobacterium sp.]MCA4915136.1 MFS transporter [Phenylobacterium sp.]
MQRSEIPAEGAEAAGSVSPTRVQKVFYSLGQAAQSGGFDTAVGFVFFYYSVVLGLSGALVGAALAIGLAFDAVVDPFIGSLSDNLKSRLGRRLPLMMAAILPTVISVGLLFSPPPDLSQPLLFAWLVVFSVAGRISISLFHVPYVALGAELTTDYAGRTSVVVYRSAAGVLAGLAITALGYSAFFANGGLQRAEGYPGFGWSAGGILFVCMTACCLGLRRFAAALPQPDRVPQPMWSRLPSEVREIFANRSFRLLFISALITYLAQGLNATLNSHSFVFVWLLKSESIQFISYAFVVGLLLGVGSAPRVQARLEKKTVVLVGLSLLIANWLVMQGAWLAGVYAPVGQAALAPMQLNSFVAGIGIGLVSVAYPSMMADAADEHEHLFGRRREGIYFAGLGFANKAAVGIGVLLAGVALDLIRFPRDIGQIAGAVLPHEVQVRLVMVWGPIPAVIAVASMVIFASYGITRARHAAIAAALRARASAPAPGLGA